MKIKFALNKINHLIKIFYISLNFNKNYIKYTKKLSLLILICLLSSLVIKGNLIAADLINYFKIIDPLLIKISFWSIIFFNLYLYIYYLAYLLLIRVINIYYNLYYLIIEYKKGTTDYIKSLILIYCIQNIFVISVSLIVVFITLSKLYELFNDNLILNIFFFISNNIYNFFKL